MAGSSLHTEGDWLFETLFFRNRCAEFIKRFEVKRQGLSGMLDGLLVGFTLNKSISRLRIEMRFSHFFIERPDLAVARRVARPAIYFILRDAHGTEGGVGARETS